MMPTIETKGITRGNHYHLRKVERFLVVNGTGMIRIRPLFGDEVQEFRVEGGAQPHQILRISVRGVVGLPWIPE